MSELKLRPFRLLGSWNPLRVQLRFFRPLNQYVPRSILRWLEKLVAF